MSLRKLEGMQELDYETVSPAELGRGLHGLGLNLICRDVLAMAYFLRDVFGLKLYRVSTDFALVLHDDAIFQLHRDATFSAHPVFGLVPETPPRGGGVQIYLFGVDPDLSAMRAPATAIIEQPKNKPHGLREATILSPEGYAFSPAVHR